jgi:hypothetical protein
MISDIPTSQDFYISGKELLDFSWDIVADLLTDLDNAQDFGIEPEEVSEEYWGAAKRRLTTALAVTQQGVELILKGKIAEVSPFILITDSPQAWPSPYSGKEISFSQFRTLDAQDLIRVYDTFSPIHLRPEFTTLFNSLREKRNSIMHSVDQKLGVKVIEVVDSILYMHKALFPNETWGQVRLDFLISSPIVKLDRNVSVSINRVCWEISLIFKLLEPAKIKAYFGVDKRQRLYFCPKCYESADHDYTYDYKLATLKPKGPESTKVYCPICNQEHYVVRKSCSVTCKGNVISLEYGLCLTCGT